MARRRFEQKPPPTLADNPGEGDGRDPRFDPPARGSANVHNRKALQLCRQIERLLVGLLGGECGDDVLRDLLIHSVDPAPDSSRLLVTVSMLTLDHSEAEVLSRLRNAVPMLRREIAASVHRRKLPDLIFRLLPRAA